MATSLKEELRVQSSWQARPGCREAHAFEAFLGNEFLSDDEQVARQSAALRRVLGFAGREVPYYQGVFRELGIVANDVRSPADLGRLPVLTRQDVQEHSAQLRAACLPTGQRVACSHRTSGTTGQPVEILHTVGSLLMSHYQKQRELRWFRFDPTRTLGQIRPARDLPKGRDGKELEPGQTIRLDTWPLVGRYFVTGPFLGLSDMTDVDAQVEWLGRFRPSYLLAQSAKLEHLALAVEERGAGLGVRGLLAISQQLTGEMRRRIEAAFGVPVCENYGLNEVGIVASRCPEGGRFHVHTEHCLVEIVDAQGRPCPPGKPGRLLVTALNNPAMPLIRYDTDDLAEVADGRCPCGRTLPAFSALRGRYRRTINLPPGTWDYWDALLNALEHMPRELSKPLRQYQLHQYRSGAFQLRLVAATPLPEPFFARIRERWQRVSLTSPAPLDIIQVPVIPREPGAKFQNFSSEHF